MTTKTNITCPTTSSKTTINRVLEGKGFPTLVDYGNHLYEQIRFHEGYTPSTGGSHYLEDMVNESKSYRVMKTLYDLVISSFVPGYDNTFLSYLWTEYFVEQDVHPDLIMKVFTYYDIVSIREKSMIHTG